MTLQYIYNEDGERIGVIVSLKEWEEIQRQLSKTTTDQSKITSKDCWGIYNDRSLSAAEEAKNLRNEWERL